MVIALLLVGLAAGNSMNCTKFMCGDDDKFPSESVCMIKDTNNSVVYTRACKADNYYCRVGRFSDEADCYREVHQVHTKIPGESCYYAEDCWLSNVCFEGVCKGYGKEDSCTNDRDCELGLYCGGGICKNQIAINSKGCLRDYDCVNNAGCQVVNSSDPSQNVCKPYFSLETGSEVLGCDRNGEVQALCSSGFCLESGNKSQCAEAPSLAGGVPTPCGSSNDCKANSIDITHSCRCGYNSDGQSYCSLFPGDKPYQKYFTYLKDWITWLSNNAQRCHTVARFSTNCLEENWKLDDADELRYYSYQAVHYPMLVNANKCALKAYAPDYYELEHEEDSAFYVAQAAVLLLFA